MNQKIEMRDPADLAPLPFVKVMPRWEKDSNEAKGFRDDIRANGIKHPLLITARGQVVDGETRRQAAIALRIMEVPCLVVPEDELQETIVRELVRRRNLTKGQLAYVVTPLLQDAFAESLLREVRGKKGDCPKIGYPSDSVGRVASAAEWAELMGFSRDLLDQAQRLHARFKKAPNLRAQWEPKILDRDRPVGLGAALAGMGGEATDQSGREEKAAYTQMSLALERIGEHAELWDDDRTRPKLLQAWRSAAAKIPVKIRQAIIEILEEA